jgi:hypothetical protein
VPYARFRYEDRLWETGQILLWEAMSAPDECLS